MKLNRIIQLAILGFCMALAYMPYTSINRLDLALVMGYSAVVVVLIYLRYKRLMSRIVRRLGNPLLDKGNEKTVERLTSEVAIMIRESNIIAKNIEHIGKPQFTDSLQRLSSGVLKDSLADAHYRWIHFMQREASDNWVALNTAVISDLCNANSSESVLLEKLISRLVKTVDGIQGAFYRVKSEHENKFLYLASGYACTDVQKSKMEIQLGEGFVGQTYYDKKTIHVTQVPKDYISISSGLGEAPPSTLCIIPVYTEGGMYGVIEVASFQTLDPHHIEYLEKSAAIIANLLQSIEVHEQTQGLLQESIKKSEEIKQHESELQRNVAQLSRTQHLMTQKQEEIDMVLATLCVLELDMSGVIISANHFFTSVIGYSEGRLINTPYVSLVAKSEADLRQFQMMWGSLQSGQTFSGEFKLIDKDGNETWMNGNFIPIMEEDLPKKVLMVSLFNTREKEKLIELTAWYNEIKECFPIVEINSDMTFKSANELFLEEIGVKRRELAGLQTKSIFYNGSFEKITRHMTSESVKPGIEELTICTLKRGIQRYEAAVFKINATHRQTKGYVVLRSKITVNDYVNTSTN